jgi:hypothetical protein
VAGIYKIGFSASTPSDDARAAALEQVRDLDQDDVLDIGIIETDEHKAAGEYLVRVVTGQPEPDLEPEPQIGPSDPLVDQLMAEREQLLARLDDIDAQLTEHS